MRLELHTQHREQMLDVTRQVAEIVAADGVKEGLLLVHSLHTTAGVTVNEGADAAVSADMLAGLSRLVPLHGGWRHAEGNSDAHLKTSLVGNSVTLPIADGRMVLGNWQGIFLCEFDGPRRRTLYVSVSGRRDS